MPTRRLFLVLTSLFALSGGIAACEAHADPDIDAEVWVKPPAQGRNLTAAYGVITNTGGADRLIGGSAPFAESVEIHTHEMDGDIARMRQVDALVVPANGTLKLVPGGRHIMVFGVQGDLVPGDKTELTLTFERAGDVTVAAAVKTLAEHMAGAGHEGGGHSGGHEHHH